MVKGPLNQHSTSKHKYNYGSLIDYSYNFVIGITLSHVTPPSHKDQESSSGSFLVPTRRNFIIYTLYI